MFVKSVIGSDVALSVAAGYILWFNLHREYESQVEIAVHNMSIPPIVVMHYQQTWPAQNFSCRATKSSGAVTYVSHAWPMSPVLALAWPMGPSQLDPGRAEIAEAPSTIIHEAALLWLQNLSDRFDRENFALCTIEEHVPRT